LTHATNVPSPPPVNTVPYRRTITSSAIRIASSWHRERKRCSPGTTRERARRTSAFTCFAFALSRTATSAPGPATDCSPGWKNCSALATIRSMRTPDKDVTRMSRSWSKCGATSRQSLEIQLTPGVRTSETMDRGGERRVVSVADRVAGYAPVFGRGPI
jgi:hypothetical protein